MALGISIIFAVCGLIVAGIALRAILQIITPDKVSQYIKCKGGWWEAELNQCESGLLMVPQQPVNTYTNIAYAAGGLFLMFFLNTLTAYTFSLTMLYLCAGSALYHATSTRWAGSLDVSAMYAVFSALTIYAASKHVVLEDSIVALIMFVVAVLSAYFLRYKYKGNVSLKIGIFIVLIYFFTIWSMIRNNKSIFDGYLIASFVLFVLAYLVWHLDLWRVFPIKRWGHGIWHLFTAAAITILFYVISSI